MCAEIEVGYALGDSGGRFIGAWLGSGCQVDGHFGSATVEYFVGANARFGVGRVVDGARDVW